MNKSYQGLKNYKSGMNFEELVNNACETYEVYERAFIQKTPEPFKVQSQIRPGVFTGFFKAKSQPDFKGVLAGGLAITFETKYTSSESIKISVLTKEQDNCLEKCYKMGGITAVLVGIRERFFLIPWRLWRVMEEQYDRATITPETVKEYEVKFNGYGINFLDLKSGRKVENVDIYRRE